MDLEVTYLFALIFQSLVWQNQKKNNWTDLDQTTSFSPVIKSKEIWLLFFFPLQVVGLQCDA